jgi:copper chaperone CopZ
MTYLRSFVMMRFIGLVAALILTAGCSHSNQQTGDLSKSETLVSFNTAGAPTVQFNVPDMMCPEGCGAKVKEILSQQPGAKDVLVDFPNKTAIVAVDKDKFDAKQAVAALVDHQFGHSTLKDGGAAASKPAEAKSIQ